jgi:hypothetical protein
MFGQPDFIVHPGQLNENMRAFVDPREHEADRYGIDGGDVELRPLGFGFVDPDAAFELAEHLGAALLGLVAGTRFALKHPSIAPVEHSEPISQKLNASAISSTNLRSSSRLFSSFSSRLRRSSSDSFLRLSMIF